MQPVVMIMESWLLQQCFYLNLVDKVSVERWLFLQLSVCLSQSALVETVCSVAMEITKLSSSKYWSSSAECGECEYCVWLGRVIFFYCKMYLEGANRENFEVHTPKTYTFIPVSFFILFRVMGDLSPSRLSVRGLIPGLPSSHGSVLWQDTESHISPDALIRMWMNDRQNRLNREKKNGSVCLNRKKNIYED